MELILCEKRHFDEVFGMYRRVVAYLRAHVNYPEWSHDHPNAESVSSAIDRGELYACLDGGKVVGAFMLSEDPEGDYSAGEWSQSLKDGEFLTVHALACDPDHTRRGVGGFMTDSLISLAKSRGYKAVRLDVVPKNTPAARLYTAKGFKYAGTKDLKRGIDAVPAFDLYELNL